MIHDGLFEGVFQTALDAIITIDRSGSIESFNPAAERLFGYTADELIGKNVRDLMPTPFREEHDGYLSNYLRTGNRKIIGTGREVVALRKDGRKVPVHLSVSEATIGDRRTFIGFARDISELRDARTAADTERLRAEAILETAVDAIITIDRRGIILSFNAAAERLFGYLPSQVVGQNVSTLTPEPIRSEHNDYINRFLQTGERRIIGSGREIEALRRDGTSFSAFLSVSNFEVDGEPFFTGIIHDITASKQRELALANANRELTENNTISAWQLELTRRGRNYDDIGSLSLTLLSCLVEQTDAGSGLVHLVDTDPQNDLPCLRTVAGHAYPRGMTEGDTLPMGAGLLGQVAKDNIPRILSCGPDDYSIDSSYGSLRPRLLAIIPMTQGHRLIGVVELAFGAAIDECVGSYLKGVGPILAAIIGVAVDQSQINDLLQESQVREEELVAANEALDQRAQELIAQQKQLESSNTQLEQQRQRLQELNRALETSREEIERKARELEASSRYKSQFLANMSHELRTPLNSIMVLSKVLEENLSGNLSADQRESARMIANSGADLLNLINDILDLSKIEAGKLRLAIGDFPIAGLVVDLERTMRPLMNTKGLEFRIDTAGDAPLSIRSDRTRLEQILRNFLSNALKFTPSGLVTLSIERAPSSLGDFDSSTRRVAFRVRDTGIGIAEKDQGSVFRPFHQVDGTLSRKFGGTGLGLSISTDLARALHGEIELTSRPGHGSEFTLTIPETTPPSNLPPEPPRVPTNASQPASLANQQSESSLASSEPIDDRGSILKGDRVVLFIEDDPHLSAILLDHARSIGLRGLVANDGETGLQLARHYRPQSIVLDLHLPDIDGNEVLRRLKRETATQAIPVHILSGDDDGADLVNSGALTFLSKPAAPERILQLLTEIEGETPSEIALPILFVEDYASEQVAVRRLLEPLGHTIRTAETAEQAIALVREEEFACIVLDLALASGTGEMFLEEYIASTAEPRAPVVIYTSSDLSREEETRLRQHAQTIILKGVGANERLLDDVTRFLKNAATPDPKPAQTAPPERTFAGRTILVVDDEVRNIFALRQLLISRGAKVLTAETGVEALAQIEQNNDIGVVLMDIMMPEMDGIEATKRVRDNPQYEKLPVIALTAKAMAEDRQRCLDAGASDYLAKPINNDELIGLLQTWMPP